MNFDPGLILGLIGQACLVVVVVYLLSRTKLFDQIVNRKISIGLQILLAVIFGALAIYGTYAGIKTTGAIANIRNMAPIAAGFLAGPWVGLGAGLIGGIHRFFAIGGFTALPCALGTVIAGLASGLIFWAMKGKIGIWKPTLFAFVMECLDMGLILLIAQPFSDALNLVNVIAAPMIIGDTIGIAIFAFVLASVSAKFPVAKSV